MFELNTNMDFSDSEEDSNLSLENQIQNQATGKESDPNVEIDGFTGFTDAELKQSEEITKTKSLMRKCSYCPRELLYQGHYRHEQICRYKQYKASKKPSDAKMQHSPKRKIQKSKSNKKAHPKKCDYCDKILKQGHSQGHIENCKLFHKFVRNGKECIVCKISPKDLWRHMRSKHAEKPDQKKFQHLDKKKIEPLNCQFCEKSFMSRGSRTLHEKGCSKYGKFIKGSECLICKKSYSIRGDLLRHMRTKHKNETDESLAKNSDYVQQSGSSVKSKISKLNSPENKLHKVKSNYSVLKNDENEANQVLNEYICYDCNKAFEFEYELAMHKKNCLKICQYCQVKIRPNELEDHQAKCYEAKKYISDLSCTICDLQFQAKPQVFFHVLSQHLNNEVNENSPEIQIKSSFVVSKFERLSNHFEVEPFQTFAMEEVDPRIVTKLYKCPICFAKLMVFQHAQDHIERFHRIPNQHFMRMGLEIEEIIVSNL